MSVPTFDSLLPVETPELIQLKLQAHRAAYDLLVELNTRAEKDKWLQVCTSESLTAGLIMSTLVNIPWGGYLKYGCFGVYDTDAKRVFNHVSVDDVYTHRCAKEMAVGILRNSNASIAIAVTGNAMPLNDHAEMVGEVFICIAGYRTDGGKTEIIYITKSINACIDSDLDGFKSLCKTWYDTIRKNSQYNPRDRTALMSQEIRHYTTYVALQLCTEFIQKNNPIVPDFVWNRKKQNEEKSSRSNHVSIPENKFPDSMAEVCVNEENCVNVQTTQRVQTKLYASNGGRKTRKRRFVSRV
jgi:nicotinamide mononucleotide (NMN) deamidase PncC